MIPMNATTFTPDTKMHPTLPSKSSAQGQKAAYPASRNHQINGLAGKMYRFHSFRVLDCNGEDVGLVDWIWSNEARDQGEFIGVQLRWLRGTARAVPANDIRIDLPTSTVRVAYTKEQITSAPRFSIDRDLTAFQKWAAHSHYRSETRRVSNFAAAQSSAA
jgi:hypothetical protein